MIRKLRYLDLLAQERISIKKTDRNKWVGISKNSNANRYFRLTYFQSVGSMMRWLNRSGVGFPGHWAISHFTMRVSESLSRVCGERARAQPETDSLGSVLASVTHFAEQFRSMLGDSCGIEEFVTQRAFEAKFVPLISTSYHFFSCVDRFAALRAF